MKGCKEIALPLILVTVLTSIRNSHQQNDVGSSTTKSGCAATDLPTIKESELRNVDANGASAEIVCSEGFSFMSGAASRTSTCTTDNTWTEIPDLCYTPCPVYRHCGDLLKLGLKNDTQYNIFPSEDPKSRGVKVSCNQSVAGGGWTEVHTVVGTSDLGIENWRALTHPGKDSEAAVVMAVSLKVANDNEWLVAYYDNVTIGPGPDYKLLSIGNYHGNAGDALCHSLGVDFIMDWWTPWFSKDDAATKQLIVAKKGSFLPVKQGLYDKELLWGSLTGIKQAWILIRPKSIDESTTCPNMVNGDVKSSSWNSTTQFLRFDVLKVPGANITYKCIGDFQMEGKAFKKRTFEGTAICLNGTRPRWDRNLTLPCTFGCEDEYTESNKTDECYRTYNQLEILNFLDSAYRCTAEGAHLVRLQDDFVDMELLCPSLRYYTVHSGMYHFNNPSSPKSSFYQCGTPSECDTPDRCLNVNSTGVLETFDCQKQKNSICMMPAVCPTDYERAGGGGSCFKMQTVTLEKNKNYGDFLEILGKAQSFCGPTGGALAQPTSLRDLHSLIGFIRKKSPQSTKHVLLGLTQTENGTWISNSFINESLLESNFNSSAWGAVVLRVGPAEHEFITGPVDVNASVCMWPGQLECDGDPPEPTENMTRSRVSRNISSSVQYKCNLGYFINGNASIPVGQTFLCVGNSGNWLYDRTNFPELQDCFKTPVCEAEAQKQLDALEQLGLQANAASDAAGNLTVEEPEFVGGSISYACPDGKATQAGHRLQQRKCVIENPDVLDSPQNFTFNGDDIQACRRCIDPPNVTIENSSGGFDKGRTYLDDSNGNDTDFVQWNCTSGYEIGFRVTTVKVFCREMGWNLTGVQNCSRVCTETQDPAADSHMVRAPLQSLAVGSVLHYNCSEGYFYGRDAEDNLQSRATETCNDAAAWVKDPPNFEQRCYHICNWRNVSVANAKIEYESDHTKETYKNGSIIEAECNTGYEWSFNETKQTFECTNDGWNSTGKKDCVRACPVSDVRPAGARMNRSDVVTNIEGTKITYTCSPGYNIATSKADGSSSETTELELTCTANSTWEANVRVESYDCKHPCGANDVDFANATSDFNSSVNYSHLAGLNLTLTCLPGFEWRFNDTEQNVSCAKTGWDTSDLHECYRVCPADTPAAGESMSKGPVTNNTVGSEVRYYCAAGFYINVTQTISANKNGTADDCSDSSSCESSTPSELKSLMSVTCTDDGKWTSQYPDVDLRCYHKCMIVMPRLINAHTDFDASKNYSDKSNKTLTSICDHGYQFAFNETEQSVLCTASGWSKKIKACYKVCLDPIKPAGEEMTVPNVTKNAVNTTMTYTCNEGYNLNATEDHKNITDTALVTCLDDGQWRYEREDLRCVILCKDDPPAPLGNASSDWNNFTRNAGAAVTYSCSGDEVFANMNSTVEIACDNGNWTSYSEEFMACALPCIDQNPPTNISNAMPEKDEGFREHEFLIYNCPPNMATLEGEFDAVLQCLPDVGWTVNSTNETLQEISERFLCVDACPGPAAAPDTNWESNWTSVFLDGTVIWYLCPNNSYLETGTERELINKCENNTWSFPGIPYCLDITTASPTTESTVIETPSPPYGQTADTHYSIIQNNMTDTDGINATYTATDAPFGFGYAVLIESAKKQCLRQIDFPVDSGTACMSDPNKCMKMGLSFCIWERHTFSQDEFVRSGKDQLKESDIKYVLSTGGDMKGHPGIAFYHHGVFQHVVVSTGAEYWHVRVPGLMANATWANVGIRWHPNVTKDDNGEPISGGLELFINKKLEGRSFWPQTASDGAKPNLNPNEMMLGCHRTNDSSEYRYFGDGEYDEIASWKRALADNETDYFLGGYMENFSQLTPQQMSEKLASIDMSNPEMVGNALGAMVQMTTKHDRPTGSPAPTSTEVASLAASSPTPAGPNSLEALEQAESLQKREDLLDLTEKLLVEESVPEILTYAQGDKYLSGLEVVSNLMSPDSASEWKTIQANGSAGSASLMSNSVKFARKAFCNIKYNNNTKPFTIAKGFDNIIFYGQKMLYEDLKARGKYVQVPDYGHEKLKPYKTKWNQIFDMGRVMTNVLNDDHCDKRPVCLVTLVFDTYDDIGPCPVNIAYIPSDREHEMGARLLYGSLTTDKARDAEGKVNYSAPLCNLDQFTMSRNPFYTKLENKVRVPAVRQLRFHSDEVVTKVSTRRCAYWNEKLSDFGAWDTNGCQLEDSTSVYTKCKCEKFGSMIVLDEKVKEPEIPPEPSWLYIVKLVLYILSAVLLVFYCIVVGYSSDLKEQFHLMGMYLSISVLIGSISMVVSDLDAIRSDRHLCTTLSTITHYFYLAAGIWVACLGHASFKAITSGEVGGKLNSYSCIAWGIAMFSVGIPYAFFVRDLGTDPRCFVTWENNGKAAFFLPQVACVCIAFFFGVVVLFNLSTPALRKENLVEDYGSFCRGAAFVMLYFAITWTFGLLAYMRFGLSVDFYPLFQVFNSAMGIIIFIFIGIASYRYRTVLVGKAKSRHEKIRNLAGIKKTKLEEEQPSPKRPHPDKTPERPATQAPMNRPPSSGQKAPERPATQASLHPPPSRGQVAGRPGSRPVTPSQ